VVIAAHYAVSTVIGAMLMLNTSSVADADRLPTNRRGRHRLIVCSLDGVPDVDVIATRKLRAAEGPI